MKRIAYGTLPTRSFFHAVIRSTEMAAHESAIFGLMQRSLQKHGPNAQLLDLLQACGFTWAPLAGCGCGAVPCLCSDVDAVAAALSGRQS